MAATADLRVRVLRDLPADPHGEFVVYWMTACRRATWSFALQQAVQWARRLVRPLVVVEVLPCGGRWDGDRHHVFVLQGMAENAVRLADRPVLYHPYVQQKPGEAEELLRALSRRACVVVVDEFPIRAPWEPGARAGEVAVRTEAVDGHGLLPVRAADRVFSTAHAFRRFLQRALPEHLIAMPRADPFGRVTLPRVGALAQNIARRWPAASAELLADRRSALARLPIDHGVVPAESVGGTRAARAALKKFLKHGLPRYHQDRNQPEEEVTSGLAAYLHHGHLSAHEIFHALAKQQEWSPEKLSTRATGKRTGFWGMDEPAEAFLDQLLTWRELGGNMCANRADYDQYDSLPDWARQTLGKHAGDRRQYTYALEDFEQGQTHDPLWNAAQMQLVGEGRMHNYLRMLWGKKILEWTTAPEEALDVMIQLNNKYALDGQDPNSYSGIFWVLGRYDRAWGPQRPVFGTIRYMSSKNTARKVRVKRYVALYAPGGRGSV